MSSIARSFPHPPGALLIEHQLDVTVGSGIERNKELLPIWVWTIRDISRDGFLYDVAHHIFDAESHIRGHTVSSPQIPRVRVIYGCDPGTEGIVGSSHLEEIVRLIKFAYRDVRIDK